MDAIRKTPQTRFALRVAARARKQAAQIALHVLQTSMSARLLVMLTLLLGVTNLQAQVPPSLVGTWVAVLESGGAVFPHLEELRIASDGSVVTRIYGLRFGLPECEGDKRSQLSKTCAHGRINAKGRLVVDNNSQTIGLTSLQLATDAMAGIGLPVDEQLSRDAFWFGPGKSWGFRFDEDALVMSRDSRPVVPNTDIDGRLVLTVKKRFFRVDDDFADDATTFVRAAEFGLHKMLCIMPFARNAAFRTLVRNVAIVERGLLKLHVDLLADGSSNSAAKLRKALAALQPRGGTPSAPVVADAAAALRVDVAQVDQFVRELVVRPRTKEVDSLLFTVLKPHEAEIRACHRYYLE